MRTLIEYLEIAVERQASDVFFVAGKPACIKEDGQIVPFDDKTLQPADTQLLVNEIFDRSKRTMDDFNRCGDEDFSFAISGLARFRVNVYRQRGSMAAVIRIVSFDIPTPQQLGIPDGVMEVAAQTSGMILVTGTAGSGKTTTQACIIDSINKTRNCHIVTLEDPIEYLHRHNKSIVSQREISIDTRDYLSALRACVRQAPDVILLGEMRDYETMQAAISAAETGHLVIATIHTKGAVKSVDRIIDSFPASQQDQVRLQLATVLNTVISQQLMPDIDGGMVPAFEIMHVNNAVSSMIRDNKTHQIDSLIAASAAEGMVSMNKSIADLLKDGKITEETATRFSPDPQQLMRLTGRGR